MNLVALPAFTDNEIWMLDDGRSAVVVVPGEAAPLMSALRARGLRLTGILGACRAWGRARGGTQPMNPRYRRIALSRFVSIRSCAAPNQHPSPAISRIVRPVMRLPTSLLLRSIHCKNGVR